MTFQQQLQICTSGHGDMHDLTSQVAKIVAESEIITGTVNVFNVGSTASVGTIEFEPGLQHDLPAILDKLIPPSRDYGHERAVARWQRAFSFAGDSAGAVVDRARYRRKAGAGNVAADLSSGM